MWAEGLAEMATERTTLLHDNRRPRIVCLVGSTRWIEEYRKANLRETIRGHIVLSIGCDKKTDDALGLTPEQIRQLDVLHLRKIELADEILIIDGRPLTKPQLETNEVVFKKWVEGRSRTASPAPLEQPTVYMGDATLFEIAFAASLGKRIRYWTHDQGLETVVGLTTNGDPLIGMKPDLPADSAS